MRHKKRWRKFGRERDQRNALRKSLAASFFIHGTIKTTEAKARETRPVVERIITQGKNLTLARRRRLLAALGAPVTAKIITYATLHKNRHGGYTRIIKIGPRKSDSARMAILELVK